MNSVPPLSSEAKGTLRHLKDLPGETVLDLPFCVAGGNGVCTSQQCPHYPSSTVGMGLRLWHGKKIYGVYASRLVPSDCEIYDRLPYLSWFAAWREQRCFSDGEWIEFCSYLDQHAELAGILLHPDIWTGAGDAGCLAKFDRYLGGRVDESVLPSNSSRGGDWVGASRLILYRAKCIQRP